MVFIFVPPKSDGRKPQRGETAGGIFVAALVALGFAIFVVIVGPKSGSPPPPIVLWVLVSIAVIFGFVGFFTWLNSQGDADEPPQDSDSEEEK